MVGQRPVSGALVLTLGILSVVGLNILTGVPAWLLGNVALDQIDAGLGDQSHREMVVIGRFLGMLVSGIAIGAGIVTVLVMVTLRFLTRS